MGIRDIVKRLVGETSDHDKQLSNDSIPAPAASEPNSISTPPVAFEGTSFERKIVTFEERKKLSYPSAHGLYVAEILLLHYCTFGKYPLSESDYPRFWWFEYGIEDVNSVLRSLEQRGFIQFKAASDCLDNLTVAQLKPLLVNKGLPVARKKADVINAIKENYQDPELCALGVEPKYELTELGEQELSDNEYVPYMHGNRSATVEGSRFGPEFNVWSINRLVHEYPERPYRDLIWGEFNRMLLETADKYGLCRNVHHAMYYFCMEEERRRDAFFQLATVLWYDIVILAPQECMHCVQCKKYEPQLKVPTLLEAADVAPGVLHSVNETIASLGWTEDDTYKALLEDTEATINPYKVFSQADFVLFAMAAIYDKPEECAEICIRLNNKL